MARAYTTDNKDREMSRRGRQRAKIADRHAEMEAALREIAAIEHSYRAARIARTALQKQGA